MEEDEITCTHCDSDYDTVSKMEDRKITVKIIYGDKIKEFKMNIWEI